MLTAQDDTSQVISALEEAIKTKNYDKVEDHWMALALEQTEPLDSFLEYADKISDSGSPSKASSLLQMLVPDLKSNNALKEAYRVLSKAAEHTPLDRSVRSSILDCINTLHKDNELLERALQVSGINNSIDLRQGLNIFDALVGVKEDSYVYHEAGWGIGQITDVDVENDEIFIDFLTKKGHRMALSALGSMITRLPADHFRVLIAYDIDRLKGLAKNDPAELIKKVAQDEGRPLKLRQIKSHLVSDVISASGWTKLWTRAKSSLRRDPNVSLGPGNNPIIKIRRKALSYEDSMLQKFQYVRGVSNKVNVVRDYLDHKNDQEAPKFLVPVMSELLTFLSSPDALPNNRLLVLILYRQVSRFLPDTSDISIPTVAEFLRETPEIAELLEKVEINEFRKECVGIIQESHPEEWPEIFEKILLSSCNNLWDLAYRGLYSNKEIGRIRRAFKDVSRNRGHKPENFFWFCRAGINGRIGTEVLDHSRPEFFEDLLIHLDKLGSERGSVAVGLEARQLSSKIRQIFFQELGDNLVKVLEEGGQERTRHILQLIFHNRGLTDEQRIILETKAYVAFPKLDIEEIEPHQDEEHIYVTEKGRGKQEAELSRLVGEELPQVAREIGLAKEFGDLSENAEYTAGLEKQAQLATRAEQMEEELKRVVIISPEIIKEGKVSIGTRVTLRNIGTETMESYTILGPWDANYEESIVSYRAALAQGLLGHEQGETVEIDLPDGKVSYEIMSIAQVI